MNKTKNLAIRKKNNIYCEFTVSENKTFLSEA